MPTLLRQGGEAGSFEFTATLFDLIRRGVYAAKPVTTERSIWGGLRTEDGRRPRARAGRRGRSRCEPWEREVANVVDGVLDGGAVRLSRFREPHRGRPHRDERSLHALQGGRVATEVTKRGWFVSAGVVPLLVRAASSSSRSASLLLLPRDRRLAPRVPALERRRADRARDRGVDERAC